MPRRFITTILAAAIAVTGFAAAPARAANPDDMAKILGGIAAVAIIGKVIKDARDRDDDDDRKVEVGRSDQMAPWIGPNGRRDGRWDHDHRRDNRWDRNHRRDDRHNRWDRDRRRHDARALPGQCFERYRTRNGTVGAFGSHCLKRSYDHANRLPKHCEIRVGGRRGGKAYDAGCLRQQGYSIARR